MCLPPQAKSQQVNAFTQNLETTRSKVLWHILGNLPGDKSIKIKKRGGRQGEGSKLVGGNEKGSAGNRLSAHYKTVLPLNDTNKLNAQWPL